MVPMLQGQPSWMDTKGWHRQNKGQQPGAAAQEVQAGHGREFILQDVGAALRQVPTDRGYLHPWRLSGLFSSKLQPTVGDSPLLGWTLD